MPVFKRDDPLLKENYRPITVLPVVDEVFEQIVAKQLVGMFDHHFEQTLTAYRKTHSCETSLINLTELWRQARDNKQTVGTLTTDISKAFDSMHPALLLSKLRAYLWFPRKPNQTVAQLLMRPLQQSEAGISKKFLEKS